MTPGLRVVMLVPPMLLALACLAGCPPEADSAPGASDPTLTANPETPTRWPFWPVRLRFHPLTRVVADATGNGHLLEARVEFFDGEGHTTKASGQLRIDLHDIAPDARGIGPLATWSRDLSKIELNREHYDVVTRTYLLRLEITENDLAGTPELRAYFLSADGRQLGEARARVQSRDGA